MTVIRVIGEVWFILSALMLAALIGRYINRKRHGEFNKAEVEEPIGYVVNPDYVSDDETPLRVVPNPNPTYRSLFDPQPNTPNPGRRGPA